MERIFKVTKQRFQIFKSALEYHFTTQIHLIFAVTILYNFICNYESQKNMYNRNKKKI